MMPDHDPRPARTPAAARGEPMFHAHPVGASELERAVIAAAAASQRAWAVLTARYDARVRRTARLNGLAPHDVDDVAQATWLCLFEHIDGLRRPDAIGAWLETTAHRESLRLLRGRRDERPFDGRYEPAPVEAVNERRLVAAERRRALDAEVQRLPERQRTVLSMMLCEPAAGYGEIACRLGIPRGSIGPTRQRGLDRLRRSEALAALHLD